MEVITKSATNRVSLVFSQKPVVDENAGDLWSDGPDQKGCGHRGIDSTGQPANHSAIPDAIAQLGNGALAEGLHLPQSFTTANVVKEVAENSAAVRRMTYLRMELKPIDRPNSMPN